MIPPLQAAFLTTPIAHRGYHDLSASCPENSLSAFRRAADAGYGIELDVQQSADGEAMVFHDDLLCRLTVHEGAIAERTAAQLGKIALNHSSTDMIPTLAEVLAVVAGRVAVLIELKTNWDTMLPTDGGLERAVARALAGYQGPVALMAFNPHCVAEMALLAPHLPRGLTTDPYDYAANAQIPQATCDRLREIPDYDATGSCFISHQAADLGRPRVAELKAQGAVVLCWTIRSPLAEAEARKIAHNVTFEGYAA
jgi:glycerophosphoryl diester phosphodiesterase